ncbi:uncharacterized protein LY89DRAFT_738818 [Mollisia scopiformis]|uniref:DUF7730 domain-containing protein n=1 Tax=Mollisia scopiformis TaxID=149040 RepID=A0A194WW54_MOLSC|nr:uncharacterized protein LY89DRAFT_738818 [Mollisia scopiformis]KUJ12200.1 hypothetical protein LY89DRAFT_738818 [Mollisia scopiformis]
MAKGHPFCEWLLRRLGLYKAQLNPKSSEGCLGQSMSSGISDSVSKRKVASSIEPCLRNESESKLISLPFEVRAMIWQYYFDGVSVNCRIRDKRSKLAALLPEKMKGCGLPAIVLTCRKLYPEIIDAMWKHCIFQTDAPTIRYLDRFVLPRHMDSTAHISITWRYAIGKAPRANTTARLEWEEGTWGPVWRGQKKQLIGFMMEVKGLEGLSVIIEDGEVVHYLGCEIPWKDGRWLYDRKTMNECVIDSLDNPDCDCRA